METLSDRELKDLIAAFYSTRTYFQFAQHPRVQYWRKNMPSTDGILTEKQIPCFDFLNLS